MNPMLDSVLAVLVVAVLLLTFSLWTRIGVRRRNGNAAGETPPDVLQPRRRPRQASRITVRGGRRGS